MTHESNDLALFIINTGETYHKRLTIARQGSEDRAISWAGYTVRESRRYYREVHGDDTFSTADILLAAAELAEYYASHIKEVDAAA